MLLEAMEVLRLANTTFGSSAAEEALRVAQSLVTLAEKKRRRELESLQRCVNVNLAGNYMTRIEMNTSI